MRNERLIELLERDNTNDNEPDWKFMEYYMKSIEYKQISKLIEYLN